MRITDAKTSMDGKTLHCTFDDGVECAFPYPIPAAVRKGRLAKYADEAQAWLDLDNAPEPVMTEAAAAAEKKAAEYLAEAEAEREKALAERAKDLAAAQSDADAVSVLDARISKFQTASK